MWAIETERAGGIADSGVVEGLNHVALRSLLILLLRMARPALLLLLLHVRKAAAAGLERFFF